MRVLIADPDPAAAHVVRAVAKQRGHSPAVASTHDDIAGLRAFGSRICIASQDLCTPDGLAALHETAPEGEPPLIILTYDQMSAAERSRALDGGVAEFVQQPFHTPEVMIRAERQLERARPRDRARDSSVAGDISVLMDEYRATKNGAALPLTKLEVRLLDQLVRSAGSLVPRETLMSVAWRDEDAAPEASLLKTHVSHLRRKLRDAGGQPFAIESSYGLGYKLTVH